MKMRRSAVLLVTALLLAVPASAWAQTPAEYKASHDNDPHTPLPGSVESWRQRKIQMTQPQAGSVSTMSGELERNYLAANQQAQQTSYYCGPASVVEALGARGVKITQDSAAYLLKTTTNGTAWSGVNARVPNPTGRPIPDVLNYKLNTSWYIPEPLPYSPTNSDASRYIDFMTFDIDTKNYDGKGYALVGNAWEVPNGPHLVGHPTWKDIKHWFEIRGYSAYGSTTAYEDSVASASSISWSGSVPPYSSIRSTTIATIMGGYGYVW